MASTFLRPSSLKFAATDIPGFRVPAAGSGHSIDASFTLRADALSSMMLVMITFIGSFIAIFSVGYMHGDPGYPRFFAAVALFISSMTMLVLADNFILLYAGWEGVGLCSYLLIGFWFVKPRPPPPRPARRSWSPASATSA